MNQIKFQRDPELRLREKMRNLSFKLSSIISLPESEKGRAEVSELLSDVYHGCIELFVGIDHFCT